MSDFRASRSRVPYLGHDVAVPRDLGPDMLRNLDDQLASGGIDQATYDSRRIEVLELIRKGKAIEYTRQERGLRIVFGVILTLFSLLVIGSASNNGALLGVLLGIAGVVFGIRTMRRGMRGTGA